MTTITAMSAAKQVAASVDALTSAEKKAFLAELTTALSTNIAASTAKEEKTARIEALKANRAKAKNDIATSNRLGMVDGLLTRHGLPTLEVFAAADVREHASMIASATRPLSVEDRFALKGFLHGLQLA